MNVTDLQETWQVDVGGQIYQTSFEELTQWIYEGSLLPQDLVRRGNLRWIEARKIPSLAGLFAAKEQGLPMPSFGAAPAPSFGAAPAVTCLIHVDAAAAFQCEVCANHFCGDCLPPGGAVICPMCGANGRALAPPPPVFAPPPAAPSFGAPAMSESTPREDYSPPAPTARALPSEMARADRKKGPGLVFSLIFSLLFAGGGAYAWAYQFAAPDTAVENALPAVVALEEKYKSEREMEEMLAKQREAERRRAEELERSKQTVSLSTGAPPLECRPGDKSLNCSAAMVQFREKQNEQFESMKKIEAQIKESNKTLDAQFAANMPDPLAALESKYKADRAKLIEKHREDKASKSFKTTFVIAFLGLMIGFVAIRKLVNR